MHPRVVMAYLRHTTMSTTMEPYANAPAADIRAAADAIAKLLMAEEDPETDTA